MASPAISSYLLSHRESKKNTLTHCCFLARALHPLPSLCTVVLQHHLHLLLHKQTQLLCQRPQVGLVHEAQNAMWLNKAIQDVNVLTQHGTEGRTDSLEAHSQPLKAAFSVWTARLVFPDKPQDHFAPQSLVLLQDLGFGEQEAELLHEIGCPLRDSGDVRG